MRMSAKVFDNTGFSELTVQTDSSAFVAIRVSYSRPAFDDVKLAVWMNNSYSTCAFILHITII